MIKGIVKILGVIFFSTLYIQTSVSAEEILNENYIGVPYEYKKQAPKSELSVNPNSIISEEAQITHIENFESDETLVPFTDDKYEIAISSDDGNYYFVDSTNDYNSALDLINSDLQENKVDGIPVIIDDNGHVVYATSGIGQVYKKINGQFDATCNNNTLIYPTATSKSSFTYINHCYVKDVALIEQNGDRAKIQVAGYTGWVNVSTDLKIVPLNQIGDISYYMSKHGEISHYIYTKTRPVQEDSYTVSGLKLGPAPSFMVSGTKYYSYDGKYFYDSYGKLQKDLQTGSTSLAVNSNSPYYSYYLNLPLRSKTNYTAAEIDAYIADKTKPTSKLRNIGQYLIDAQNKYGVNALAMLGIAINESAWGMSSIAQAKNNIFGLGAVDANPGEDANAFASVEECINNLAKGWVSTGYADPDDPRYHGSHLGDKYRGLNVKYASDPYWSEKAADKMYRADWAISQPDNYPTDMKDYNFYQLGMYTGHNEVWSETEKLYKVTPTYSYNNVYTSIPFVINNMHLTDWYQIYPERTTPVTPDANNGNAEQYHGNYDYNFRAYTKKQNTVLINTSKTPSHMHIDKGSGEFIYQDVEVSGWALNGSGVREIKVYVNGTEAGNATMGLSRPDVNDILPGYPNGKNSGFSFVINKDRLKTGDNEIKVVVYGNDGSVQEQAFKTTIKMLPNTMYIDKGEGTFTYQDVEIKGWALNGSGVKEIKVYVNEKEVGNATTGLSRPDVNELFPSYPDGKNSGFNYVINMSHFKVGANVVKVRVYGNDGSIQEQIITTTITMLPNSMHIDDGGGVYTYNDVKIRGWALNGSGVKEIKVSVNGVEIGNATPGLSRPDVNNLFPGYPDGENSGFNYVIDKKYLKAGDNEVKVKVYGNDGSIQEQIITTTITMLPNSMHIDSGSGSFTYQDVEVKGWALNGSGVKEIKVSVNGKEIGNATIGLSRPDVNDIFPGYPNGKNSGYNYVIDKKYLKAGDNEVKVKVYGNDGSIQEQIITTTITMLPNSMHIDSGSGSFTYQDVEVKGWALNGSGVKEIKVSVNGKEIGNATIGLSRPDVNDIFPGYPNGKNSGYNYVIDKKYLRAGDNEVKVKVYGNDGSIQEQIITTTITVLPNSMHIDSGSGSFTYQDVEVKGWALNGSGVKEIKVSVNGKEIGNATIGLSRPDVNDIFPGYPDGENSGFNYVISKDNLIAGDNLVTIKVYGNDGTLQENAFFVKIS